jgi:hypothetical protein
MFKTLREIFVPRTPEETYLDERLRSARWLGWDMTPAPRPAVSLLEMRTRPEAQDEAPAEALLSHPAASGKPA